MGVVYPITKNHQNREIFIQKRPHTGCRIALDMRNSIAQVISKRENTLSEKIEIPINNKALCTTRTVYLIGLSHFLQRLKPSRKRGTVIR